MKKIIFFLSILFFSFLTYAQAPQGINYQGVARNSSGNAYSQQPISIRFSILQSSTPVYVETHSTITDTFGLYSAVIGQGSVVSGTFSTINWGVGTYSVKIEIDPNGGGYQNVQTTQLMSVPYALYAGSAGNSSSGTVTNIIAGNGLSGTPTNTITTNGTLSLSNTGVAANTYGNATSYPVIAVDATGRITSATTQTVSGGNVVLPGTGLALGTVAGNTVTIDATNSAAMWNADKLQGTPVNTNPPAFGDFLKYNGTQWTPTTFTAGTVTSVTVTAPMSVLNPNTTPLISMPAAGNSTDGYLTKNDWLTFNNKGNGTVTSISTGIGLVPTGTFTNTANISADTASPIWNAKKLYNTPVSVTAPLANDILQFVGGKWSPAPFPGLPGGSVGSILYNPAGTNWAASVPTNIFTNGTQIGIGNNTPNAMLDVVNSNAASPAIGILNNASGYGLNIQNTFNGSGAPGLNIYHNGTGPAAYITSQNGGNNADVLYVETKGNGNAIKGYTDQGGSAVIGYSRSKSPTRAGY